MPFIGRRISPVLYFMRILGKGCPTYIQMLYSLPLLCVIETEELKECKAKLMKNKYIIV